MIERARGAIQPGPNIKPRLDQHSQIDQLLYQTLALEASPRIRGGHVADIKNTLV